MVTRRSPDAGSYVSPTGARIPPAATRRRCWRSVASAATLATPVGYTVATYPAGPDRPAPMDVRAPVAGCAAELAQPAARSSRLVSTASRRLAVIDTPGAEEGTG